MVQGFSVGFGGGDPARGTGEAAAGPVPGRPFARRRRNRHGRGLRGPLLMSGLPGSRTRMERFEDLVAESAERLEDLWGQRIESIVFEVEMVPHRKALEWAAAAGKPVPLGRTVSASPRRPAKVVVFRRPVEELAEHAMDLPEIVHAAVVELVAELLMMPPEEVDPAYLRWHGRDE